MAARPSSGPRTGPAPRAGWALVGVVITGIWGISVLPGDTVGIVRGLDTVGHIVEFAVLGTTTARATNARARALIVLSVALVVGLGTEASQLLAVQRSPDVADVAADLLGAMLGAAAWSTWAGPSRRSGA